MKINKLFKHLYILTSILVFGLISFNSFGGTVQGPVKLLGFSGSARTDSCNKKSLELLAKAAREAGSEVAIIDLSDYPMPMYDGDLEASRGLPENAKKLQALIAQYDGLLIASPEYNGLPTPLLKNVIDWSTRTDKNNPTSGLKIFQGKTATLIAASAGPLGGIRGLPITSQLFSNIGLMVLPEQVAIPDCFQAFEKNGTLKNKELSQRIQKQGKIITKVTEALRRIES